MQEMEKLSEDFAVTGQNAKCNSCGRTVNAKSIEKKNHLKTKVHLDSLEPPEPFDEEIATTEIMFAALAVMTGLSFLKAANILCALQMIFDDSTRLKKIKKAHNPDQYRR